MPTSIATITTIQPISASHSRCADQPERAENEGPEMKSVANEGKSVGRDDARIGRDRGMNCVDRHRYLSAENASDQPPS